mmetsp:Transcript_48317/g.76379  ORF Transcript_48317/g.76379 Transcript_48317/m.76379 type:complete len:312 (+) Transcript_48317:1559-2494(+)
MASLSASKTKWVTGFVRLALSISRLSLSAANFLSFACLSAKMRFKSAVTSGKTASAFWISPRLTIRVFFASFIASCRALTTPCSPSIFSTSAEASAISASSFACIACSMRRLRSISLLFANSISSLRSSSARSQACTSLGSTPASFASTIAACTLIGSCEFKDSSIAFFASSCRFCLISSWSLSAPASRSVEPTPVVCASWRAMFNELMRSSKDSSDPRRANTSRSLFEAASRRATSANNSSNRATADSISSSSARASFARPIASLSSSMFRRIQACARHCAAWIRFSSTMRSFNTRAASASISSETPPMA